MTADADTHITHRAAAEMAARLHGIREAQSALRKEDDALSKALKQYLRDSGEPIAQEGVPTLALKEVGGLRSWDVMSMPEDMVRFLRERGALNCSPKVVDGLAQQGLTPAGLERYEMRGTSERLEFER